MNRKELYLEDYVRERVNKGRFYDLFTTFLDEINRILEVMYDLDTIVIRKIEIEYDTRSLEWGIKIVFYRKDIRKKQVFFFNIETLESQLKEELKKILGE